jgi:hypothetical protein
MLFRGHRDIVVILLAFNLLVLLLLGLTGFEPNASTIFLVIFGLTLVGLGASIALGWTQRYAVATTA